MESASRLVQSVRASVAGGGGASLYFGRPVKHGGQGRKQSSGTSASDPATDELFAHLRRVGQWIVRDDVFIKFLQRHGGLTIGYGSPNQTGLELELGTLMGNQFAEPVLLIKTAWGGHSLYQRFRSPGAGLPAEKRLQQELEQSQKRVMENNKKIKRTIRCPRWTTSCSPTDRHTVPC